MKPNWLEIQVSLANTLNEKNLEKGTKDDDLGLQDSSNLGQLNGYIRTLPKNEYLTTSKLHHYINVIVLPSLGHETETKVSEKQEQYPHLLKTTREDLIPGTNNDGWWNMEKLVKQVKEKLIPLFEATHPNCIMMVCFDNATSHGGYSEDALRANKMNLHPGGSYKIRDTVFNDGQPQEITLSDGRPKGIKMVLEELLDDIEVLTCEDSVNIVIIEEQRGEEI
ncbi:2962_t:CDS:2, partial [Ambispora gerdemannii]